MLDDPIKLQEQIDSLHTQLIILHGLLDVHTYGLEGVDSGNHTYVLSLESESADVVHRIWERRCNLAEIGIKLKGGRYS